MPSQTYLFVCGFRPQKLSKLKQDIWMRCTNKKKARAEGVNKKKNEKSACKTIATKIIIKYIYFSADFVYSRF